MGESKEKEKPKRKSGWDEPPPVATDTLALAGAAASASVFGGQPAGFGTQPAGQSSIQTALAAQQQMLAGKATGSVPVDADIAAAAKAAALSMNLAGAAGPGTDHNGIGIGKVQSPAMSQFQAAKPGFPLNPAAAKVQSKMIATPAGMKARPPLTAGLVPGTLNPGAVSGVGRPQFPRPGMGGLTAMGGMGGLSGGGLASAKLNQMPGRPFMPGAMSGNGDGQGHFLAQSNGQGEY